MNAISASTLPWPDRELVRQISVFGAIGVVSTAAYVVLYSLLREAASPAMANAAALLITALGNTAANRRLTFEVRGSRGLLRDHAAGLIALAIALAITSAALAILPILDPRHGRFAEIAVLVAANAAATLARFLLLRLAIDRSRSAAAPSRAIGPRPAHSIATLALPRRIRG
jgi:putative flippase GtrA